MTGLTHRICTPLIVSPPLGIVRGMEARFQPLPSPDERLARLRSVKPHDAPNDDDAQRSGPHLLSSVAFNAVHAGRHASRLDDVAGDEASVRFAAEHITHHIGVLAGDLLKLRQWLRNTDSSASGFAAEDDQLQLTQNNEPPPAA